MNRHTTRFPILFFILGACHLSAQNIEPQEPGTGTQIAWASEAFSLNLMADGVTTFGDSGQQIRFELGTFAPGFDPTTASPEQWASSWIVLQGAEYDLVDGQFINTTTLYSNADGFAVGSQAFIWGYNTLDINEGTEWILMAASDWKWPSAGSLLPTTFSLSSETPGSAAILGTVNDPATGSLMQLQAVYPLVVPEPSVSILAAISSTLLLRRRRSRG